MTPEQQEKIDRVALQLYEHILMPWFQIDEIADALEVPRAENKAPDVLPDMAEVTEITQYLIAEEEMDPDAEEFELATILKIGLYIYGFQHRNDPY